MNSERKGKASSNFQIDLVWIFLDNIIPPLDLLLLIFEKQKILIFWITLVNHLIEPIGILGFHFKLLFSCLPDTADS